MTLWRNILLALLTTIGVVGWCAAQGNDYARYAQYLSQQDRLSRRGEMGITVGAAYMWLDASASELSLSPKMGVRAALEYSLLWEDRYALQMEVAYLKNRADVGFGKHELELHSNVVEVPVMFSYRGLRGMRFGAGVVLSPMASGRYDTGYERVEFGQLRQSVGYTVDVGVSFTPHLLLDVRYVGSFGETDNHFEGREFSVRSAWLSVSLGYMF